MIVVSYTAAGGPSLSIEIEESHDAFAVLEFVRSRMYPGVAVIPYVPEPVEAAQAPERKKFPEQIKFVEDAEEFPADLFSAGV